MSIFAAIQMASGPQVSANLLAAGKLIADAARQNAEFVVLPENFAFMGLKDSDQFEIKEQMGQGPLQSFLSEQAARHDIWICGGTIPIADPDSEKVYAVSLVFDNKGQLVTSYKKIHLFDVELTANGESYTESDALLSGDVPVVFDTPFGRVGIGICYDVRFPEHFRALIDQGAEILLLPAAFTALTGKAHWEVLLRARAIENLAYVVAAAQGGYHVNGRATYGHSMIVDPWGSIVGELKSNNPGVITGEINSDYLATTRRSFPALDHRRI